MNKKTGISLIVLVVTMVVLIIIVAVVILALSDTNYLENLDEMSFKNDLAVYAHEVINAAMNYYTEDKNVFSKTYTTKEEIAKFSGELSNSDFIDIVVVKNGELTLKASKLTDIQKEWAKQINLQIDEEL